MMLSFLAPYKTALIATVSVIAITAGSYAVHKTLKNREEKGYNRAIAEYRVKELAAEQAARKKEQELTKQVEKARNESIIRDQKINDLSIKLDSTSSGLRDTIATLRRQLSAAPRNAANTHADTSLELFGECAKRYADVAEAADRHASDVKLLQDAWPK